MNIYLDIDGVLIKRDGSPANNVTGFLKSITHNHDVYWLTTHCRQGKNNIFQYLKDKLPRNAVKYLEKVNPTDWNTLKTEAINFRQDFLWFDDYILEAEKRILKKNNCQNNYYLVDLKSSPDIFTELNKILFQSF